MARQIRFGDFAREITVRQRVISCNELIPAADEVARQPERLQLRPLDVYRIVEPYLSTRFLEQVRAVLPLAIYLVLFQLVILRQHVADSWIITAGLLATIIGLMLFMEGLKVGLMPFGETIEVKD